MSFVIAATMDDDIIHTVTEHLNLLETRLADSEIRLQHTIGVDKRIDELLDRQLKDGLISFDDYVKLDHVKQLWVSVSIALDAHVRGCEASKRQITDNLLDLLTLNELSRELLINIVVEL